MYVEFTFSVQRVKTSTKSDYQNHLQIQCFLISNLKTIWAEYAIHVNEKKYYFVQFMTFSAGFSVNYVQYFIQNNTKNVVRPPS